MKQWSNCLQCNKPLKGRQSKFCSTKCKNAYYQSYQAQKERGLKRKAELAKQLGNCCSVCGYLGNLNSLLFRDPLTGVHFYNTRELANVDFETAEKKVNGLQLICKNCDSEAITALPSKTQTKNTTKLSVSDFERNLNHCKIKADQTIVLGVSGGVDSTVMLDLFVKSGLKLNIIVAHLNHGIRKEAANDQKFVANLAKTHGLKFATKIIAPANILGNLEEGLRNERRKFLLDIADKYQADFVALAHNANDQAETVIFNLVRGAGPAGLGGMSMSEDKIIRPLLNYSRVEITGYANENKLKWIEDTTNNDTNYSRNYIRHEILPKLARLNPEYLSTIYRSSHLQRKINEKLNNEANNYIVDTNKNVYALVEKIKLLDLPTRHEIYAVLYEKAKGNRKNFTLANMAEIDKLIGSTAGTEKIDLPDGFKAVRKYQTLEICAKKEDNIVLLEPKTIVNGKNNFGNWLIIANKYNKNLISLDTITVEESELNKYTIRTWQSGDKIAKRGLNGTKKLQDLFTDAKIDKESRKTWPIITKDSEIIWIPGVAVSRNLKQNSKNYIKLTARKV